jgi:hypothetical protein
MGSLHITFSPFFRFNLAVLIFLLPVHTTFHLWYRPLPLPPDQVLDRSEKNALFLVSLGAIGWLVGGQESGPELHEPASATALVQEALPAYQEGNGQWPCMWIVDAMNLGQYF